MITSLAPDLIALQEVDSRGGPSSGRHQLAELAERTAMSAIAGPTILEPNGDYGNGILTRVPPRHVELRDLSLPGREPRGLLSVVVALGRDGRQLRFSAMHLGLSRRERVLQAKRIVAALGPSSGMTVDVLAGDLNEWWPSGRSLRTLRRLFRTSVGPPSFPSWLPVVALDRLMARPPRALASVDVKLSSSLRRASDHLPVVAELSL